MLWGAEVHRAIGQADRAIAAKPLKKVPMSRALAACLLAALWAAPAFAQQPAAPPLGGPAIPGLCSVSIQDVIGGSKVGQAATTLLRQLSQPASIDLNNQAQAFQADAKALAAKRATLKTADYQAQQQALQARYGVLQAKNNELARQVEATRMKALNQISTYVQPVVAEVYKAHGCGLLLDRAAVLGGNLSGDLTAGVIQGLDARVTTITFQLEPPQAAPAQ